MKICSDGSVIYAPNEHEEAQRALACVHELRTINGKSSKTEDKHVTGFNTNTTAVAEGGK